MQLAVLLLIVLAACDAKSVARPAYKQIKPSMTYPHGAFHKFNGSVSLAPASSVRIAGYWPGEEFQMDFVIDSHNTVLLSVRPENKIEGGKKESVMIFNTEIDSVYDVEEKRAIPLISCEDFVIEVRAETERLVFIINNSWYKSYEHRVSPTNIKSLLIKGGVHIKSVEQKSNNGEDYPDSTLKEIERYVVGW